MMRRWWLGAGVVCLLASALLARQGIIKTNDGRTLQGDIDENSADGQSVNITIHGSTLTILRSSITSIDYAKDPAQDFHQRLAKLDPTDIKGRIDLSRSMLDARQYDLAAEAAKDVQRIDPHNADAKILLNTIESQRALDAKRASVPAPPTNADSTPPAATPTADTATTAPSAANPPQAKFLTMDDIYTIRREELLPDDQVRVQFTGLVRKRYLDQSGADATAFNNESQTQQALDILQLSDPQLSKDVKIVSDPAVLAQYRTRIQPRVLAGCAAAGCHGSTGSGGFYLYPNADKTAAWYTNFYILDHTSRKVAGGDTFGSGPVVRPMIDRLRRDSSLILQFGLPTSIATTPHPKVAGWAPMFRSDQDANYIETAQWISSLKVVVPDNGIHFEIPKGNPPATQPSTDAATNPG